MSLLGRCNGEGTRYLFGTYPVPCWPAPRSCASDGSSGEELLPNRDAQAYFDAHDVIRLRSGCVYRFDGVTVSKPKVLIGNGALVMQKFAARPCLSVSASLEVRGVSFAGVWKGVDREEALEGRSPGDSGIWFRGDSLVLVDCDFSNFACCGLFLDASGRGKRCVRDCSFSSSAVGVVLRGGVGGCFRGCHFEDCRYGFYLLRADDWSFTDCDFVRVSSGFYGRPWERMVFTGGSEPSADRLRCRISACVFRESFESGWGDYEGEDVLSAICLIDGESYPPAVSDCFFSNASLSMGDPKGEVSNIVSFCQFWWGDAYSDRTILRGEGTEETTGVYFASCVGRDGTKAEGLGEENFDFHEWVEFLSRGVEGGPHSGGDDVEAIGSDGDVDDYDDDDDDDRLVVDEEFGVEHEPFVPSDQVSGGDVDEEFAVEPPDQAQGSEEGEDPVMDDPCDSPVEELPQERPEGELDDDVDDEEGELVDEGEFEDEGELDDDEEELGGETEEGPGGEAEEDPEGETEERPEGVAEERPEGVAEEVTSSDMSFRDRLYLPRLRRGVFIAPPRKKPKTTVEKRGVGNGGSGWILRGKNERRRFCYDD